MKLEDFFEFGKNEPINRIAYTNADAEYKMLVMKHMQEIGMKLKMDECGNICGVLGEGKPITVMGSHTDSVSNGGQYDGPVGVISALMAINDTLKGKNIKGTMILSIYACEESTRFKQACIGSRYLAGELSKEDFLKIATKHKDEVLLMNDMSDSSNIECGMEYTDNEDVLLIDAISYFRKYIEENKSKYGIKDIDYVDKIFDPNTVDSCLEMHIEQYEILQNSGNQIGIVNSIVAPLRGDIEVLGKSGHSGSTPMDKRIDAVRAASKFIEKVSELAEKPNSGFRVTFPKFQTNTWGANQIQNRVELFMDMRQQTPLTAKKSIDTVYEKLKKVAEKTKVNFEFRVGTEENPTKTDERINKKIQEICEENDIKSVVMPSWAGHDTAHLKNSALLFIPSTGGSHNKDENTTKQDIETGISVYSKYLEERVLGKQGFVEKVDINYDYIETIKKHDKLESIVRKTDEDNKYMSMRRQNQEKLRKAVEDMNR